MVSLRRRRLLGLSSGNNSLVPQLPLHCENLAGYENSSQHDTDTPQSEQPVLSDNNTIVKDESGPPNISASNSSKEQPSKLSKEGMATSYRGIALLCHREMERENEENFQVPHSPRTIVGDQQCASALESPQVMGVEVSQQPTIETPDVADVQKVVGSSSILEPSVADKKRRRLVKAPALDATGEEFHHLWDLEFLESEMGSKKVDVFLLTESDRGNNSFAPQPPISGDEKSSQHDTPQSQPVVPNIASVLKSNTLVKDESGPSNVSGSNPSIEQPTLQSEVRPGKRRKPQVRKPIGNQEPCLFKGVYFKGMKWEAAIKVNMKQIHLGVFGSKEEAAHLYDRAAFLIGREANFELAEEEKEELRRYTWEEFLAITREARRKRVSDSRKNKSAD